MPDKDNDKFFAPVNVSFGTANGGPIERQDEPGPFTLLCEMVDVETRDAESWLRSADYLVEDILDGDGIPKKARKQLKHLVDFIGNAARAQDELRDAVGASKLRQYRRLHGELPRSL